MARLTQSEIRAKADEWAAAGEKLKRLEAKFDEAAEPFIEELNAAMAPLIAEYEPKLAKLRARQNEISAEINEWLNAQGKPITIAGEKAIAAVEAKVGSRVVDPKTFFDLVKAKGAEFWACLRVEIGKAEKLLGSSTVDGISTKKTHYQASLRLK